MSKHQEQKRLNEHASLNERSTSVVIIASAVSVSPILSLLHFEFTEEAVVETEVEGILHDLFNRPTRPS